MHSARATLLLLAIPAVALAFAPAPFRPSRSRDWPGWRGSDRTGVSVETGLLARWAKVGPKLLWKTTTLGTGFSSPALSRGRLYVLGTRNQKEYVLALDAAREGKELWATELGPLLPATGLNYPGPRSTPTVDDDRVYTLGSEGNLLCLDRAGNVIWRTHLVRDLKGARGTWGYAESPLIDRDVLICTPGGANATMVALNKKTGAVVWKAVVPNGNQAAYASAIVAEVGGVRQYVQFLGGCLAGIAARDGKLLWTYDGVLGTFNCCTPIFHDGHVFISAFGRAGKAGGVLLKLTAGKEGVTAKEVYRNADLAIYHGGVVRLGGALYGTNSSALVCVDFKTGKTRWKNSAVGKGAILAADGHLYVRGDRGTVALVKASPEGYTEKSRFDPPHRAVKVSALAYPAIADGRLYLRDQEALLCYDLKNE
jgi:outer membrane protein assembly factor BamB